MVFTDTLSNKFLRKTLTTSSRVNTATPMVCQAILYHTQKTMIDGSRTIGGGIEVGLDEGGSMQTCQHRRLILSEIEDEVRNGWRGRPKNPIIIQ
jgi:hypothetical protein